MKVWYENGDRVEHITLGHAGTVQYGIDWPQGRFEVFVIFDGHEKPIEVGKRVLRKA